MCSFSDSDFDPTFSQPLKNSLHASKDIFHRQIYLLTISTCIKEQSGQLTAF